MPLTPILTYVRVMPLFIIFGSSLLKVENLAAVFAKIKTRLKSRLQWLVIFNRCLLVVFAGFVVYAVMTFYLQKRRLLPAALQKNPPQSQDDKSAEIVLPEPKPFNEYGSIIGRRDIFSILQANEQLASSENHNEVPPIALESTQDWIKNLKLVGILLDGEPRAVIEDSKTNETVFLSHGQQLDKAVLEDIQEGKVIFLYQGHRVELAF